LTEQNVPTAKQLATLSTKISKWLDQFYATDIFTELDQYNHLDQNQYGDIVQSFARDMLVKYDRQPSRWTIAAMNELLETSGNQWADEVSTQAHPVNISIVLDVLSDFLDFAGQNDLVKNGGKLADIITKKMDKMDEMANLQTIVEHIGKVFIKAGKFFNMNANAVQDSLFLNEHLTDVILLAENTSFMDLAMIAAIAGDEDMVQGDFLEKWLAQYAFPEINVQTAGDEFANALGIKSSDALRYNFVMTQLHNEMTPVAPATRLSVAMRLEGMELKDGDITQEVTFLQKHRDVLHVVPEMLDYLPKEELSRRQREKNGRRNNVLSFAAAKKLAKKRNKH
jgi:hypothetical protein